MEGAADVMPPPPGAGLDHHAPRGDPWCPRHAAGGPLPSQELL